MEVPLYLMLICIAIVIRGGGTLSVDQLLRREIRREPQLWISRDFLCCQ